MIRLLIWVVIVLFVKRSSLHECGKDVPKNVSFTCEFLYENSRAHLQCTSTDNLSDKTFNLLKISWKEGYEILHDSKSGFQAFLSSNFTSGSAVYVCESAYKNFISYDPFIISQICTSQNCLNQFFEFIDERSIRKLEIKNSKDSHIFKILDEFPLIVEINCFDNFFLNLSEVNFLNFKRIKYLSLRNNSIDNIPDEKFSNLTVLESLDLSQNSIKFLSDLSFENLFNLKTLNLSFNDISSITNGTFATLTNIKFLYLAKNKLASIDDNAFIFNAMLKSLDLSANPLHVLPERLLWNLNQLENFFCSECHLTKIPDNLFFNSIELTDIDFSGNEIDMVPVKTFERQTLLKQLHLNGNKLNAIPDIKNKTYLITLHLHQNEILSLSPNLSKEAPGLAYLNVSKNKIQYLFDDHVKKFYDLEIFDLSQNEIVNVRLGSDYVNVRKLYLSNNSIAVFDVQWDKFVTLEVLEMNYNQITYLELPPCIPSILQTVTISFRYNKISRLNMMSLFNDESRIQTDRTMAGCLFNGMTKNFVDLSHNPLICDCELYSFYKYLKRTKGIVLNIFLSLANVTCAEPLRLQNESIIHLREDAFNCSSEAN